MLANWQCMYAEAKFSNITCVHGGVNSFYKKGSPACFGLFLYFDLASTMYRYSDVVVYKKMRNICHLDQEYAKEVTGLSSIFVSESMKQINSMKLSLWMKMKIEKFTDLLIHVTDKEEIKNILRIQKEFLEMCEIGKSIQRESEDFALKYYKERIYENPRMTPQHSLKAHDPLTMMKLILFSIHYCDGDVVKTFKFLTSSIGDVDTVSFFFGTIAGAYYGKQVDHLKCDNKPLIFQLNENQEYMKVFYQFDHQSISKLFAEVSNLDIKKRVPKQSIGKEFKSLSQKNHD
jgi:hypothetical protein